MSTYYSYNDPILITWRDPPYVETTDNNLLIVGNKAILTEIPSEFTHVQVTGLTEIFSGSPTTGQFIVNYSLGEVVVNPSLEGTSINAHFFGRGVIRWPAERIYEHTSGGDLQTFLEDLTSTDTSLQGQIDSISLADSNAQIGVYSLDATGTNTLSATYVGLTYFNGLKINLTIENTNTGAVTLNLNASGAVDLKYVDSDGAKQDIPPGGLLVGNVYLLEYDNTDFIVLNNLHAPDYTTISATYSNILPMSDYTLVKSRTLWNLKGMTYSNTGLEVGLCQDTADFDAVTSTLALSTTRAYGTYSVEATATATGTFGARAKVDEFPIDASQYYLVSAFIRLTSSTNVALEVAKGSDDSQISITATSTSTTLTRVGLILQPSDIAGETSVKPYVKGTAAAIGNKVAIDGIMVNKISAADYALGVSACLIKYPFVINTQSTSEVAIESVGKNLFDKSNNIKSDANITHVVEESRNCVKFDASKPFIDDVFPLGNDFQASTQYTIQYTAKQTNAGSNPRLRFVYTDGTTTDIGSSLGTVFVAITATSTAGKTISHIKFVYTGVGAYYLYVDKDTIQIEEGSTATTYVPYTITQSFIPTVGKRLPNDTGDTIEIYSLDGSSNPTAIQTRKIQRVSDTASISDTAYDSIDTGTYTNVDVVKTTAFSLAEAGTAAINSMTRYYNNAGTELTEVAATSIDYATSVGKYYYHTDKALWIIVTGGAYSDISTARTVLATSSLDYQLATSVTTQVIGISDLLAHTDGTVYVEKVARQTSVQNEGILLSQPISSFKSVTLVDGESRSSINTSSDVDTYRYSSTITAATGTTGTEITSTGHSLSLGDRIRNTTRDNAIREVLTAPTTSTFTVNAVTGMVATDSIEFYKASVTDTTQDAIVVVDVASNESSFYEIVYEIPSQLSSQPEFTAYVAANQAAKIHMMEEALAINSAEKSVDIAYQNAVNTSYDARLTALES